MRWLREERLVSLAWRWLAALMLGLALVGAQAASAADSSSATIMVFAPGAPQGAIVNVEWLDPLTNVWVPVTGWSGTLNQTTANGTLFQAFAVLPANYGQSSFRWVVFNLSGSASLGNTSAANPAAGSVWGVSSAFSLPATDGATLQTTILPMELLQQTNAIVGVNTAPTTTSATTGNSTSNTNPTANATASIIVAPLTCQTSCNASAITAKFAGLPASSWIAVEWLDGNGVWQPVLGWQGQADFIDASGNLVKQFGVYQRNYGQGPFRWAVYNAASGGSLLAVSPKFNLPVADGQNEILNLAG